jgi:hypothetical protein
MGGTTRRISWKSWASFSEICQLGDALQRKLLSTPRRSEKFRREFDFESIRQGLVLRRLGR